MSLAMNGVKQEREHTMDEILASIRRAISGSSPLSAPVFSSVVSKPDSVAVSSLSSGRLANDFFPMGSESVSSSSHSGEGGSSEANRAAEFLGEGGMSDTGRSVYRAVSGLESSGRGLGRTCTATGESLKDSISELQEVVRSDYPHISLSGNVSGGSTPSSSARSSGVLGNRSFSDLYVGSFSGAAGASSGSASGDSGSLSSSLSRPVGNGLVESAFSARSCAGVSESSPSAEGRFDVGNQRNGDNGVGSHQDSSLLSAEGSSAVQSSLSNLKDLVVSQGLSITLESLVLQALRPVLKDWLDSHLPDLVERMVHEEIGRVIRARS